MDRPALSSWYLILQRTLQGEGWESPLNSLKERVLAAFETDKFIAYIVHDFLPGLVAGLVVFGVFFLGYILVKRAIGLLQKRAQLDDTVTLFINRVAKVIILTWGLVAALNQVGFNATSFVAGLGVLGLSLGFAAKDALSNIISGIFIFLDRPFVIGDLIEIEGQYGRVAQITMRSTRVVTVDGKMLAIPNTKVVNSMVASFTNFPNLRLDIDVTIGVEENIAKVRRLILDLIEARPNFMTDPAARVVVTSLNDYNIALQVQAWIANERDHISERHALREAVFEALRNNDIDMPYEIVQFLERPPQVKPRSQTIADPQP